jgi:hypothetical protein
MRIYPDTATEYALHTGIVILTEIIYGAAAETITKFEMASSPFCILLTQWLL